MESRYSFTDLFTRQVDLNKDTRVPITGIVIPKIQRPYAQGRSDSASTYIRDKFVDEIFAVLASDDDEILDLNFIYGIVKPANGGYRMELLDGQQRLTTLFLLYWYVANAELGIDQPESLVIRDCLARFSYETRATSTAFCQELAAYKVALDGRSPRAVIRNCKWYFKSFDRDSTISAMLTMLDAIHDRYVAYGRNDMHSRLQRLQFYVKSLGVFNLSEELYIKMNARGLQLTPFENFKADLTNCVASIPYEPLDQQVPLHNSDSAELESMRLFFSIKLDAKWIDIFWRHGAADFDQAYMSFFSRFFACKYIVASKDTVSDRNMRADKAVRFFYTDAEERMGSNEYHGFKEYEMLLKAHPEYIVTLDKVLDVLYQYDYYQDRKEIFGTMLAPWDKAMGKAQGDDFYCNTSSKISHTKLIALSAVIEYVEAFDGFDAGTFKQWMRVVWNVIENTDIDSLTPVSSLVRKFSAIIHFVVGKMRHDADTFYAALSRWRMEGAADRENRAVIEEVEKARRIAQDASWEAVWEKVESHPFFKGMATFFYNPSMSLQEYLKHADVAQRMFDANGIASPYTSDGHKLIRAIVSQIDTWKDGINELYITERAERNRFLKNILAANEKVGKMLADVTGRGNDLEVKKALDQYIADAPAVQPWPNSSAQEREALEVAVARLRTDALLYDWIAKEEAAHKACFRVYWFEGHIMFAIPRKWYARVALDTHRALMARHLCQLHQLEFYDKGQEKMLNKYGDCYGNDIWLFRPMGWCKVWVHFDHYHQLRITAKCDTPQYVGLLANAVEGAQIIGDDKNVVLCPILYHGSVASTFGEINNAVKRFIEIIGNLPGNL